MALAGIPGTAMLGVPRKEGEEVDLSGPLKALIVSEYEQDPKEYDDKLMKIQSLRKEALQAAEDEQGVMVLQRYHGQLEYMAMKFRFGEDQEGITYRWKDAFGDSMVESTSDAFERASVLFNLAAVQASLAAKADRDTVNSLKAACTYFQAAAGVFCHIKEYYTGLPSVDCSSATVSALLPLLLAQALECIVERSVMDGGNPSVLSKLTMQCATYYSEAHSAMDEIRQQLDACAPYTLEMAVKQRLFKALAFYYRAAQAASMNEFGPRVAYLQEAVKAAKAAKAELGWKSQAATAEATKLVVPKMEEALATAIKENDAIYHELVPESVPELPAVSIVKPSPLLTGPDAADLVGPDIFNTLVPMAVTLATSQYSEEKAKLMRETKREFEACNAELQKQLAAMGLPGILTSAQANGPGLPAPLQAKRKNVMGMGGPRAMERAFEELDTVSATVERLVTTLKAFLEKNGAKETRATAGADTERAQLERETLECVSVAAQATESNQQLAEHYGKAKAMVVALCEEDVESTLLPPEEPQDPAVAKLESLMMKVDQMTSHRTQLETELKEMIDADDITDKLLHCRVYGEGGEQAERKIMDEALEKYQEILGIVRINIEAQGPLLRAVAEANAAFSLVHQSSQRRELLMNLEKAAETYEYCVDKITDAQQFWKGLEKLCGSLLTRWQPLQPTVVPNKEPPPRPASSKPPLPPKPGMAAPVNLRGGDSIPNSRLMSQLGALSEVGYNPLGPAVDPVPHGPWSPDMATGHGMPTLPPLGVPSSHFRPPPPFNPEMGGAVLFADNMVMTSNVDPALQGLAMLPGQPMVVPMRLPTSQPTTACPAPVTLPQPRRAPPHNPGQAPTCGQPAILGYGAGGLLTPPNWALPANQLPMGLQQHGHQLSPGQVVGQQPIVWQPAAQQSAPWHHFSQQPMVSPAMAHQPVATLGMELQEITPRAEGSLPVAPQTVAQQPITPQTMAQFTVPSTTGRQSVMQQAMAQQPVIPQSVVQQPTTQQSMMQQPMTPQTMCPPPIISEAVAHQSIMPQTLTQQPITLQTSSPQLLTPQSIAQQPIMPETMTQHQMSLQTTTQQQTMPATIAQQPMTPQTPIQQAALLQTSTKYPEAAAGMCQSAAAEQTVAQQPVSPHIVAHQQPLSEAVHAESVPGRCVPPTQPPPLQRAQQPSSPSSTPWHLDNCGESTLSVWPTTSFPCSSNSRQAVSTWHEPQAASLDGTLHTTAATSLLSVATAAPQQSTAHSPTQRPQGQGPLPTPPPAASTHEALPQQQPSAQGVAKPLPVHHQRPLPPIPIAQPHGTVTTDHMASAGGSQTPPLTSQNYQSGPSPTDQNYPQRPSLTGQNYQQGPLPAGQNYQQGPLPAGQNYQPGQQSSGQTWQHSPQTQYLNRQQGWPFNGDGVPPLSSVPGGPHSQGPMLPGQHSSHQDGSHSSSAPSVQTRSYQPTGLTHAQGMHGAPSHGQSQAPSCPPGQGHDSSATTQGQGQPMCGGQMNWAGPSQMGTVASTGHADMFERQEQELRARLERIRMNAPLNPSQGNTKAPTLRIPPRPSPAKPGSNPPPLAHRPAPAPPQGRSPLNPETSTVIGPQQVVYDPVIFQSHQLASAQLLRQQIEEQQRHLQQTVSSYQLPTAAHNWGPAPGHAMPGGQSQYP